MDISKSREFYEEFFAEDSSENPVRNYWNRQRYEILFQLIEQADFENDINVLEVGSGSGRISRWLDSRFTNVFAVDIGLFGQMQCTIDDTDVNFALGALPNLPFSDEFDLVICSEVLEHLPSRDMQQEAVEELSSVADENGTVIITTPNPMSIRERTADLIGNLKGIVGGSSEPNDSGGQLVENWIPPTILQSYFSEHFFIRDHRGSYYTVPDRGTGLAKHLRPISDYITRRNLAPNRGVYQYYVLEVD